MQAEEAGKEEAKEGEEEESEYDEEAYGEEDYDEEGKYIWGKEGAEWDYYYKEDKEANERGDPIHPDVINQGMQLDIPDNIDTNSIASTATGSSGVYKTKKKGAASTTWKPK